jgi:hypothetical protein
MQQSGEHFHTERQFLCHKRQRQLFNVYSSRGSRWHVHNEAEAYDGHLNEMWLAQEYCKLSDSTPAVCML